MQNLIKKLRIVALLGALMLGGYMIYHNYYATTQDNVKIQGDICATYPFICGPHR